MADNPFANMALPPRAANPQGSFTGLLDRIMGVPTQDQINMANEERVRQEGLGRAQGERAAMAEVMQSVATIRENNPGADPQMLITQAMRDPAFQRAAMKIPADKMQAAITEAFKATTPARPEMKVLPQGATYGTADPTTGVFTKQGTTPNAKETEYDYLLSKSPEERATLAASLRSLTRAGRNPSENEEAVARMVARGEITQAHGDRILAGTLKVQQLTGPNGEPEGAVLIDTSDPNAINVRRFSDGSTDRPLPGDPVQARPTQQQGAAPGAQPQPYTAQGDAQFQARPRPEQGPIGRTLTPQEQIERDRAAGRPVDPVEPGEPPGKRVELLPRKADMFDGAGPIAWAAGEAGKLAGNIQGLERTGEETNLQRNALNIYAQTVTSVLKEGRTFKSELNQIEHLLPNTDLNNTNPLTEINKAIGLRDWIEQSITAERATEINRTLSRRRRIEAQEKVLDLQRVLRTLPDRDDMLAKREEIRTGRGGTSLDTLRRAVPSTEEFRRGINESAQPKGTDPRATNQNREPSAPRADGKPNQYEKATAAEIVELFSKRHTLTPEQQRDLTDELRRRQKAYTPQR